MSFYSILSRYYKHIFPINEKEITFLQSAIQIKVKHAMDIGCGIGHTASTLASMADAVIGIDANQDMVKQAQKEWPNISFIAADMRLLHTLDISDIDVMTCFGNTLVHINNQDVFKTLKQWSELLTNQGKLMIQIINYDRIMSQLITSLPTIDHPLVSMQRLYHHHDQTIQFETSLTDKQNNQTFTQQVTLYPLLKQQLEQALVEAGFDELEFFGGFDQQPWTPNSYATIVIAKKRL